MGVPLEPGFLQIAGHEIGRQARDLGQRIVERLLVEAGRRHREDPRDPAARQREADTPGDVRVLFHITVVGGLMSVEPPALAWMRSRAPFEREQAGGRLGQRRDDEPAARQGVGADLPPAHRGRRLSAEFRVRAKLPPQPSLAASLGLVRTYTELFRVPEFTALFVASSAQVAASTVTGLALGTLVYSATGSPL